MSEMKAEWKKAVSLAKKMLDGERVFVPVVALSTAVIEMAAEIEKMAAKNSAIIQRSR